MSILNGFLFGLTLQLSVGPVFFAVLHKAIKQSFAEAFKMVIGVAIIDAFYIVISFTGVGALLKIHIFGRLIFWVGAGLLIFFGLKYLKSFSKQITANEDGFKQGEGKVEGENRSISKNSFLYGIKLTFTNPLTIVFWSGTFGALIGSQKLTGLENIIFYSAGCVLSTIFFLGIVSLSGRYLVRFLNAKALKYLDCAVGLFLIFFGVSMLIK